MAGNASGRNCALGPNHFSSDHTSEVAKDRPPPPLLINSGFPTSILKKQNQYSVQVVYYFTLLEQFLEIKMLKNFLLLN